MKSWTIASRQPGVTPALIERPVPTPGKDRVLIQVKGASANPADLKVISGKDGGKFLHASKFPLPLGYDFAGVVTAIGPGVSNTRIGDEVYGCLAYAMSSTEGAFSEYVMAPAATIALKPRSLGFPDAACLPTVASTALQALRDKAGLKAGHRLFVHGASGGVGSMAVQMGRILGATVWGSSSAKNTDYVQQLGAERALDYRTMDLAALGTFDVVFDVASNLGFAACAGMLSPRGVYVTLLPTPLFIKGFVMSWFSKKSCRFVAVASKTDDLSQIARWIDDKALKLNVEMTFPFSEVPVALTMLRQKSPRGKIALAF